MSNSMEIGTTSMWLATMNGWERPRTESKANKSYSPASLFLSSRTNLTDGPDEACGVDFARQAILMCPIRPHFRLGATIGC